MAMTALQQACDVSEAFMTHLGDSENRRANVTEGRFTVIWIVYDRDDVYVDSGFIQDTLLAYEKTDASTAPLVLVNNVPASKAPKMSQYLRSLTHARKATRLLELENLGCGGTFNRALIESSISTEFVVYMSSDAKLTDAGILGKVALAFDRDSRLAVVSPISVFEDPDTFNLSSRFGVREFYRRTQLLKSGRYSLRTLRLSEATVDSIAHKVNSRPLRVRHPHPSMPLTFTTIRRRPFEEIGGFDADFFAGHENNDLALRMLRAGYRVGSLMNSFVYHKRVEAYSLRVQNSSHAEAGPDTGSSRWQAKWGESHLAAYARLRYPAAAVPIVRGLTWLQTKFQGLHARLRWLVPPDEPAKHSSRAGGIESSGQSKG